MGDWTTMAETTLTDLGVVVSVPPGWQVGRLGADGPVALTPETWEQSWGVRPSLSFVGAHTGSPVTPHRAGSDALALVLADQDTHVVGYDVWPGGRRLTWLTWAGPHQLVQQQWVVSRADRVVTATATTGVEGWATEGPLLRAVAEGAEVAGEPVPERPYSARWRRPSGGRGGPQEPRRDTDLVGLGINLEDLSGVAHQQRFRPGGVTVDRDGLVAWLTGDAVGGGELTDVGLVERSGRPTPAGVRVRTVVGEADRVVQVDAAVGVMPLSFSLYRRGGDAVVVCTDGISQWLGDDPHGRALGDVPQRVHVIDLPTVATPGVLCSWLGIGPAWSLAVQPDEVDRDLVVARVQDPGVRAPAGAGAALEQVWARLGALWTLRAQDRTGRALGMAAASAGDRGPYELVDVAGQPQAVRLVATPGPQVLDVLLSAVVGELPEPGARAGEVAS